MRKVSTMAAAALVAALVAPVANAQASVDDPAMATTQPADDDDFPWGLLGLAGLLGLLGRKRDDRNDTRRP